MSHKIRLGPIAVFLTVIAAVLVSLALLTVSTSRADAVLAERFAAVTKVRYELEADGNLFLKEADAWIREGANGALPAGAELTEAGGLKYYLEKEGYALTVEVTPQGADGFDIKTWKISKIWESDDLFEDLWMG